MNIQNASLGGSSILQLAAFVSDPPEKNMLDIMMSYVITTPNSRLIVIDGGHTEDADKLRRHILERGGHVDLWLLTHPHWDHIDAFTAILKDPQGVTAGTVVYDFPPVEWLTAAESNEKFTRSNTAFAAAIRLFGGLCVRPRAETGLTIDGVEIKVLCDPHEYETVEYFKYVNNLSIAYQIRFPNGTTALFLGDLGPHASIGLVAKYGSALQSDIVQMSHHGFHGAFHGNHTAMRELYRLCAPKICLWPTTRWLWTNLDGTGPYTTPETRQWVEEMGCHTHLLAFEGDWLLQ